MPVSFNMMLTDLNDTKLKKIRLYYHEKHNIGLTRLELLNVILKMVFNNYSVESICDKAYNILHPPKEYTKEQQRTRKLERAVQLKNKN